MRNRLVTVAALAVVIGAAADSAFYAPWYVVRWYGVASELRLLDLDYPHFVVFTVALLVNVYFFVRLLLTGMLVLYGGPTSARTVAWLTPTAAYVQAGASLVAALVMYAMTPEPYVFADQALPREAASGGALLVGANLGALVALIVIGRNRALARTQTWVDDDGAPIPKKRHRWLRSAPAERPLVKAPLESAGMAGDPFRGAPPTGLTAQLVKPPAKTEAPRRDDDAAPAPKLLT
jgi:hypothetical protein